MAVGVEVAWGGGWVDGAQRRNNKRAHTVRNATADRDDDQHKLPPPTVLLLSFLFCCVLTCFLFPRGWSHPRLFFDPLAMRRNRIQIGQRMDGQRERETRLCDHQRDTDSGDSSLTNTKNAPPPLCSPCDPRWQNNENSRLRWDSQIDLRRDRMTHKMRPKTHLKGEQWYITIAHAPNIVSLYNKPFPVVCWCPPF